MTDTIVEPNPPTGDAPPPPPDSGGSYGIAPQTLRSGSPDRGARVYMTGDLRAATGLTRTHLDFYLREGLVRPSARAESGYLLFDEAELTTLRTLLRWRRDGIGLKQIRERLGR